MAKELEINEFGFLMENEENPDDPWVTLQDLVGHFCLYEKFFIELMEEENLWLRQMPNGDTGLLLSEWKEWKEEHPEIYTNLVRPLWKW